MTPVLTSKDRTQERIILDLNRLPHLNLLSEMEYGLQEFTPESTPIYRAKKWKLDLDIELGTGILFEQLSARRSEFEGYANSVQQVEKPLDFYHGQIGLTLNSKYSSFYFKTGLSLSLIHI